MKKILAYLLALSLFAATANAQIIHRGGGGGGGGGGGDASAANQATQITALPLEDTGHTTGDRGAAILGVSRSGVSPQVTANDEYVNPSYTREGVAMNLLVHSTLLGSGSRLTDTEDGQFLGSTPGLKTLVVRDDVLEDDAGVGADLDFTMTRVDNRGAAWTHNDPVDAQLDLQVTVSASANGTTIDVSGVNLVLVHITHDGSWDRGGTVTFEGFMGSSPNPEERSLPFMEFQSEGAGGIPSDPIGRRSQNTSLNNLASDQAGYLVDVRGFQGFRARLTITSGTAGTTSIHAHLVKNSEGIFNSAMALQRISDGVSTVPDFALMVSGLNTGATIPMPLTISRAGIGTYSTGHGGYPAHGINNEDLSTIASGEGQYSPFIVDDEGRQIHILSHNSGISGINQVSKLEEVASVSGDSGIPMMAIFRDDFQNAPITSTDGGYTFLQTNEEGSLFIANSDGTPLEVGGSGNTLLGKREDDQHATLQVGVPAWGVTNESFSAFTSTGNDDYSPIATNQEGQQQITMHYAGSYSQGNQVPKLEDAPAGNGDPGFLAFGRRNDDRATSHIGADNDMGMFSLTEFGEIWTVHSGAAFFAITDTAIVQVSQNFSFGFDSKKVMVVAPSTNAAVICLDWLGGTAVCPSTDTAGDDVLEPGESIILDDFLVSSISAISASGSQTVVVRAWN